MESLRRYPVAMILALALIRRTRRGSARSWLALPATIIGLIFAVGLVMHLLSKDLYAIWATFAALSVVALVAPLVALIAVRIVAGRTAEAVPCPLSHSCPCVADPIAPTACSKRAADMEAALFVFTGTATCGVPQLGHCS